MVVSALVAEAEQAVRHQAAAVKDLAAVASQHAYYRYNGIWTRHVQDTVT